MGASSGGGGSDQEHSQKQAKAAGFNTVSGWRESLSGSGTSPLGGSTSRGGTGGFKSVAEARAAGAIPSGEGSRLGQSGAITSRQTTTLSPAETNAAASRAGLGNNNATVAPPSGVVSRTTSVIPQANINQGGPLEQAFSPDPLLRLTPDGLLLQSSRPAETSERLGSNTGGGGSPQNEGISPPPAKPEAPATPPSQPSPPAAPRQRAAALKRGPAVEQPRTLLTLSLADVTKKSLMGV